MRSASAAVMALVCLLASAPRARGGEPAEDPIANAREGRDLYRQYCAACHGVGGRGDGFVAPALGQRPPDLTVIARDNGGEFPFLATVTAIDGTAALPAHGISEMPVWGEVLAPLENSTPEQERHARRVIILITEHVRGLQRD
jgi:mono/diheme cytochrome c family protein